MKNQSPKTQSQPHSKKKIFFHSCHSRQLSGFGKNCKNVLKYLHSTGRFEIVEYANSYKSNDKTLNNLPWKCIGSGPSDPDEIIKNNASPELSRKMSYGLLNIDAAIKSEKPDIYIGAEDIWALMELTNKPWWNKINCMIWTTLDSLPLFPEAINLGKEIEHYYTWATFASKALNEKGVNHAACLHGAIETKNFFKLPNQKRLSLRNSHNLKDEFVIGFVFRNQLRKSVPNLLKGFKLFKKKTKNKCKAKLLLHTGWHEGWDIPSLMLENNISEDEVLTTYVCEKCKKYSIKPFTGKQCDCSFCDSKKTLKTITVRDGISEKQLNEIYNLMDVYCHPFTSGGQEIPIQEAKLTELVTLSTNYSCGTDMIAEDSGGFDLDWSEFREQTTQFIKASTDPESICEKLLLVYNLSEENKEKLGKQARNFILNKYAAEVVGKKLEGIIDRMQEKKFDFDFEDRILNIDYQPKEGLSDLEWVIDIYKNMLGVYQTQHDKDAQYWTEKLSSGATRNELFNKFKNICNMELNQRKHRDNLNDLLIENKKLIGIQAAENEYNVLLASSLINEIVNEEEYKECQIVFFCENQYKSIILNNPQIKLILPTNLLSNDKDLISKFHVFFNIDNIIKEKPAELIKTEVNQFK